MSQEFKSKEVTIQAPAGRVYEKMSRPENLRRLIDEADTSRVPADKLEQLRKIEITSDSIRLEGGPTGAVTLRLDHCEEPVLVRLKAADLPMELFMELRLKPLGAESCEAQCALLADIPMMLRPMLKGPLQKVADKVAELLSGVPF